MLLNIAKNQYRTLEDIKADTRLTLSPLIISYPKYKLYLLVIINLKSNQIISHKLALTPWTSPMFNTWLDELDEAKLINNSNNTCLHCLKITPFTTKAFLYKAYALNLDLSFHNRNEILPNILDVKNFFRLFLTPETLQLLPEYIEKWNTKYTPIIKETENLNK